MGEVLAHASTKAQHVIEGSGHRGETRIVEEVHEDPLGELEDRVDQRAPGG